MSLPENVMPYLVPSQPGAATGHIDEHRKLSAFLNDIVQQRYRFCLCEDCVTSRTT